MGKKVVRDGETENVARLCDIEEQSNKVTKLNVACYEQFFQNYG